MAVIEKEDILGIYTDEGIVCSNCMTDEEWKNITMENIIERRVIEMNDEEYYFCDRCKNSLG